MLKKILVIQTAFIGDVILATGVIEKFHRQFPNAGIDIVVRKGNESLLKNHPFIGHVYVWDKKNKWSGLYQIIREVRVQKYDLAVNLQRFTASAILTILSGAKQTAGFRSNFLSVFFNHSVKHRIGDFNNPGQHEIERNQVLISKYAPGNAARPVLYPPETEASLMSEKFITISPASVWYTKQTPEQVWIDLINGIQNYKIYLLGAPGDRDLCERIRTASNNSRVESMAGRMSLLQSAALMKHAAMNYTNDSAPMHLASAVNAPVTAVYCSTIPEFGFGPLSDRSFIVQHKTKLTCKPCGIHGHRECPEMHFNCGKIDVVDLIQTLSS